VRSGRQHPLVAANDHQKRSGPFFAAVAGSGFDRFHRFAAQAMGDLDCQTDQLQFDELGDALKVNFSETTK